jgi:hypothetical protein
MLNLLNLTSKFHTVAIFEIIDLKTTFHSLYVDIFINYAHTKFNMPRSSGSLVFAIKPKTKENLRLATLLYFKFCKRACLKHKLHIL